MGIAERKARERLLRHQQILDAAYEVFNEVGFSAATMDQIAERAELAKGTIYIYFKSKEEVYFSLLVNGVDILIRLLTDMGKRNPAPGQLLEETAKTLLRYYNEHTIYFRIFMVMQQEDMQAKLTPELAQQINAQVTTVLNLMSTQVQNVIDKGSFARVNPWHVANILWGAFVGMTNVSLSKERFKARPTNLDDLVSDCFQLIHRGLSVKPSEAKTRANRARPSNTKGKS